MELFVHTRGAEAPRLVEVDELFTVREVLEVHGREGDDLLWIEDGEVAVGAEITIEQASIRRHSHVHMGHCRRVDVEVRFGGASKSWGFAPSARIARVFEWALGAEGFNLPPDQRPEHDLIVCGGDHPLAPSVHVGSLASDECSLCLDLAAKHNPQG